MDAPFPSAGSAFQHSEMDVDTRFSIVRGVGGAHCIHFRVLEGHLGGGVHARPQFLRGHFFLVPRGPPWDFHLAKMAFTEVKWRSSTRKFQNFHFSEFFCWTWFFLFRSISHMILTSIAIKTHPTPHSRSSFRKLFSTPKCGVSNSPNRLTCQLN